MFKKTLKILCLVLIICMLTNCASTNEKTKNKNLQNVKSNLPKVPKYTIPGGTDESWRYLGTTENNQIAIEINESSIVSSAIQTYKFQDRKTIINPNTFVYTPNQKKYRFALGYWLMDCANKQYLLNKMSIYDIYGTLIQEYDYTRDDSVKWLKFGNSSIGELQYNYICLNQNRFLGY